MDEAHGTYDGGGTRAAAPADPTAPTTFRCPPPADAAPVEAARRALAAPGLCLLPPAEVSACLGTDRAGWRDFAAHWESLRPDPYAAETGTRRLRRYGHFRLVPATGEATLLGQVPFVQPDESNPLYVEVDRVFESLSGAFVADPLFRALLAVLGRVASVLDDAPVWDAKAHLFRVVAPAGRTGNPTPEGRHRDGVTLVTSLLVDRRNARGGESAVTDPGGRTLFRTTLSEPGTLLLGDDRRTLHEVTPVRPRDPAAPARRDVLVTTLAPRRRC